MKKKKIQNIIIIIVIILIIKGIISIILIKYSSHSRSISSKRRKIEKKTYKKNEINRNEKENVVINNIPDSDSDSPLECNLFENNNEENIEEKRRLLKEKLSKLNVFYFNY